MGRFIATPTPSSPACPIQEGRAQCRLEVRDRSLAFFGWFWSRACLSRSRIVIRAR
jgi:hypothetical protein